MKIKFSKNYSWMKMMQESDISCLRKRIDLTTPSEYSVTWEEADVTAEQLEEYVSKGYAITINC